VEAVNGQPVEGAEEYRFRVRELAIGATAQLGLRREGQRRTVAVRAVELPLAKVDGLVERRTGLRVEEVRQGRGAAVAVAAVRRGSAAARAGVEGGDLLVEVNGREVETLAEFRRAASRARRSGALVLLVRRGRVQERIPFDFD
jgi:serine protease Do